MVLQFRKLSKWFFSSLSSLNSSVALELSSQCSKNRRSLCNRPADQTLGPIQCPRLALPDPAGEGEGSLAWLPERPGHPSAAHPLTLYVNYCNPVRICSVQWGSLLSRRLETASLAEALTLAGWLAGRPLTHPATARAPLHLPSARSGLKHKSFLPLSNNRKAETLPGLATVIGKPQLCAFPQFSPPPPPQPCPQADKRGGGQEKGCGWKPC